jgi:hypothetical protein
MPLHPDRTRDGKKSQALAGLKQRYREVRELVSPGEPHENLEWVLGAGSAPDHEANLNEDMIELVGLWLQDLTAQVDGRLSLQPTGTDDESLPSFDQTRQLMGQSLRAATEGFLVAFRSSN